MAQVTRFNGDYTFEGANPTSNVVITTHSLVVNGNLKVLGTVANVAATNTQITDNIITLNQGENGNGVTSIYAGLEIDRGNYDNVYLRWNEAATRWELTADGSTYVPIATGSTGIASLEADTAPALGGNLNVKSRAIYSSTIEVIKHDTNVAIKNTTVAPSTLSGYNTLYAATPAQGSTGIFVTNDTVQQQELITKNKALFYALMM